MDEKLAIKLGQFAPLSADDRDAIVLMSRRGVRTIESRRDVIREGDNPDVVNLILEGWACRYKMLEDGRRQITAFLLPGDLCDQHVFILRRMDHSIGALTPLRIAQIPREALDQLVAGRPQIVEALWWETLVASAIQREWTVSLGQRSAIERTAHLLCELLFRLRAIGMTRLNSCQLPITQTDLADASGLTPVHINRTVQALRARGLIHWAGKDLEILDHDGLARLAMFDPTYLHSDR